MAIDTTTLVHHFIPTCTPMTVAYGDPCSPVAFVSLVFSIRIVALRHLGFFCLHIACAAVRLLHDLLFYCGVVGTGLRTRNIQQAFRAVHRYRRMDILTLLL
jgi:hypothetical protein